MDNNLIIGLFIGIVLGLIFIAISIPEFRKLKKNKEEARKKELEKESNSNFDID